MAESLNVVYEETIAYPFFSFLSDTGGAAGLFLGLNVIGILGCHLSDFGRNQVYN